MEIQHVRHLAQGMAGNAGSDATAGGAGKKNRHIGEGIGAKAAPYWEGQEVRCSTAILGREYGHIGEGAGRKQRDIGKGIERNHRYIGEGMGAKTALNWGGRGAGSTAILGRA